MARSFLITRRTMVFPAVCLAACQTLSRQTSMAAVVAMPSAQLAGSITRNGSATVPIAALTPAQISTAYGVNNITLPNVAAANGAGQTIALIDAYDDPYIKSDLQTFDTQFGLPNPPSFQVLNQTGGTALPAQDPAAFAWALEETIDVEWAHAIAPAANIILFEANSSWSTDLYTAVQTAKATAGVSAISMSWGSADYSTEASNDPIFTSNPGHGVTFIAATGDGGTGPDYPAVSPNVMGVGGTTLSADAAGNYLGETAWSDSAGGKSTYEARPSYQSGISTPKTSRRTSPDVSMDADADNSGVAIYDSVDGNASGNWFQAGGTSLAAPMWAGLIAITDQGRAANGLPTYDGATGTLPRLYSIPYADFNDITTGGNSDYNAGVGYDMVTGLGTPIANELVPDLANIVTVPEPLSLSLFLPAGLLLLGRRRRHRNGGQHHRFTSPTPV